MNSTRIALIAATAIAALYGAGLYYEQSPAAPHCCGLTWPTPDPTQAERLMASEDPKGTNSAVQRRIAVNVLSARPMESSAWLRLAYADRLKSRRLTEEGRHAIEMSYLVEPYAGRRAAYRIGFALDNWSQITPQTRRDTLKEVALAQADDNAIGHATSEQARRVQDPSGRVAAALLGLLGN